VAAIGALTPDLVEAASRDQIRRAKAVPIVVGAAVSFEDHDEIGSGTSINVIDACYANESNWEPESSTQFERCTNYGILRVERMRPGGWAAYRDDCELRNCRRQQAIFSTRQQAQRAADKHAGDRYPNSNCADGGVHWSEQSNSHYVPRGGRLGLPSPANSGPAAALMPPKAEYQRT
jgi:hypothetical protein